MWSFSLILFISFSIHIDEKSDDTFFDSVKMLTDCFSNVYLTRREYVEYTFYSRLQADLNCMEDLLLVCIMCKVWT